MSVERTDGLTDAGTEAARLRAQVTQLEDELASLQAWANAVVADAQKRVYWLDRLHLDLDPVMRHMPIDFALGVYRKVRHRYDRARRPVDAVLRLVRRPSS